MCKKISLPSYLLILILNPRIKAISQLQSFLYFDFKQQLLGKVFHQKLNITAPMIVSAIFVVYLQSLLMEIYRNNVYTFHLMPTNIFVRCQENRIYCLFYRRYARLTYSFMDMSGLPSVHWVYQVRQTSSGELKKLFAPTFSILYICMW